KLMGMCTIPLLLLIFVGFMNSYRNGTFMITPLVNIMHLLSSCICTYVLAIPNLLPLQFETFNFSSYLASNL
ncbi:hypothetical protein P9X10_21495, partial [Bacillus cereus]|nr:hypothetical protein [Bacillus cereus]